MSAKKAPVRRTTRRKKRTSPLVYLLTAALLVGVSVILWLALRSGYDVYVRSTYTLEHQDVVMQACEDYHIAPALVYGIIRTESGFDEKAVSSANAKGLMQVTDTTLEWIQLRSDEFDDVSPDDLFDPEINIRCGVYLLSLLFEQFDSEQAVIAAYNAGLGNVTNWLADSDHSVDGQTLDSIPFAETKEYVSRVLSAKDIYEQYYHLEGDPIYE